MTLLEKVEEIFTILAIIGVILITVPYFLGYDHGPEETTKVLTNLFTFWANESIPLIVNLVIWFGGIGIIVYIVLTKIKI